MSSSTRPWHTGTETSTEILNALERLSESVPDFLRLTAEHLWADGLPPEGDRILAQIIRQQNGADDPEKIASLPDYRVYELSNLFWGEGEQFNALDTPAPTGADRGVFLHFLYQVKHPKNS